MIFSMQNIQSTRCDIYRKSAHVFLTQDDAKKTKVWELFDHQQVSNIVTNLNQILVTQSQENDLDLDPMRRK